MSRLWVQSGRKRPRGVQSVPALDANTATERLAHLESELARLRAGESALPPLPNQLLTPGQWLSRFNRASVADRLSIVAQVLEDARSALACFHEDHRGELAYLRARERG